ncbi:hypothetical protein CJ468_06371 [Nocardia farcinica]|nr:hypothetical protein CJ468_06371 [Nocardia farcinica]
MRFVWARSPRIRAAGRSSGGAAATMSSTLTGRGPVPKWRIQASQPAPASAPPAAAIVATVDISTPRTHDRPDRARRLNHPRWCCDRWCCDRSHRHRGDRDSLRCRHRRSRRPRCRCRRSSRNDRRGIRHRFGLLRRSAGTQQHRQAVGIDQQRSWSNHRQQRSEIAVTGDQGMSDVAADRDRRTRGEDPGKPAALRRVREGEYRNRGLNDGAVHDHREQPRQMCRSMGLDRQVTQGRERQHERGPTNGQDNEHSGPASPPNSLGLLIRRAHRHATRDSAADLPRAPEVSPLMPPA